MNYKAYNLALREVANYTDRDAFVSDLALSSIWGDDESADIPAERLDDIGKVWDAANRGIKDIAAAKGVSVRRLASRFGIPLRTAEAWASSSASGRTAPAYLMLMMQECLGLLPEIEF